jgi:hypothetical protein
MDNQVMRTLRRLSLFGFAIVIITGVVACSEVFSQSDYLADSEKKAREVLEKSVQALGGEAFRNTRDVTRSGRVFQFRKDDLQGLGKFQAYDKFPLKQRVEFEKGHIVNINDGDQGWKIEYKVVKEQSPEEIRNFRANINHSLDYLLRFRLNERGMKFRYLGRTRMDLEEVEGVQLIDQENDRVKIFVSVNDFLPVKMEYQSPGFGKRWPTEDQRLFYNYHQIAGVQIPFKTVRFSNGFKSGETHLESARINSDLPDTLFVPKK